MNVAVRNIAFKIASSTLTFLGPTVKKFFFYSKVIRALKRLHEDGIVHRDIKLSNILIDPVMQKVQLCDFGSAALDQVSWRLNLSSSFA